LLPIERSNLLRRLHLSPGRAFALFVGLLLLLALAVFAYTAQRVRQEIETAHLRQAATLANLFEDRLSQTLGTVRLVLRSLRDDGEQRLGGDNLSATQLSAALRNAPFLRSISLLNATGRVEVSSEYRNVGVQLNLADFDLPPSGRELLHFGRPQQGRDFYDSEGGRNTSFLPVMLMAGQEEQAFYLVAVINPGYFLDHIETLLPQEEGSTDVLLADGRLFLSSQPTLLAGSLHPQDLELVDFGVSGFGSLVGPRHDGRQAYSAWRSVRAFPLLVSVHMDQAKALGAWGEEVRRSGTILLGVLLLILGPATLLFMGERRALAQRAQVAKALAASEERYRLTLSAIRDGLWDWDVGTDTVQCDAHWYELLGYGPQAFNMSMGVWQAQVHPDDQERFQNMLREGLLNQQGFLIPHRLATLEGGWRWVEMRGKSVAQEGGAPQRVVGTLTDISDRVTAEQAVASEARHRTALLDHIAAGVFLASGERRILEVSARGAEMFGYRPEELQGQSFACLHVDLASYEAFAPLYDRLRAQGQVHEECLMRCRNGELRWFSVYGTWLDSGREQVIWTLLDVTASHQMSAALLASNQRLEVLINQFPGALLVEDQQRRIVLINHTFCEMFDLEERPEGVVGEHFGSCAARIRERFSHPEHFEWQLRELGDSELPVQGRELALVDGRVLEHDYMPILDHGRLTGRLWAFWDVTERKQQERELKRLASTDSLTSLPNRRIFMERLELEVARAERYAQGETALLMLDLDHFKLINDRHGHGVGDQVLQGFSCLLQAQIRRTDLAGRVGGEEFAVLLPGVGIKGGVEFAERLRSALHARPMETSQGGLQVTMSAGVTLLGYVGESGSMAMGRADAALYRAKENGRDRVEVAFPDL